MCVPATHENRHSEPKPIFTHDGCPGCRFQGSLNGHDIWTCGGTVMRRYGDYGPEYESVDRSIMHMMVEHRPEWAAIDAFLRRPIPTGGR